MRHSRFLVVPVVALLLAACGGGGSSYSTGPGGNNPGGTNPGGTNPGGTNPGGGNSSPNTVTLTATEFQPSTITVATGTTVTWNWNTCDDTGGYGGYGTCVSHNILFDDGSNITSGTQSTGTFSRTFATAGTYKYHCTIHGSAMSGQVVVQ